MRQIEEKSRSDESDAAVPTSASSATESVGTVMDILCFVNDNIILVDEAERLH